ncbi:patatin-like phospholipase family protein [Pontibacter sp. SGAir0037]|uniref:patatin-like phospholipase family protein n=1 Tax=Pontibacter sp. SGAir0037 TaxID=2571030 RepID=UPI0010CD14E2|nr:patatin-like phospholipase family protein [Pontibacter sp. SGAir0037]QCR22154.1 hypothetical protein C1N53_07240 [Pontibacter sp. SGAir0037]
MKIGLALSGGGARGIAHLGVLKAFDELGIRVNVISGVSSGAIAGVFYAAGYKPSEILKLIKELSVIKVVRPTFRRSGLMNLSEVEKLYHQYLGEHIKFEHLKIPVVIGATEMSQGINIYYSSGELIKPLLGTTAVPVLYQPVEFEGKKLNDGGLLNNLPIDVIQQECDLKIGVHVNPINHQANLTNLRSLTERTVQLAINNNVRPNMHLCDLLLEPQELKYYRLTSFYKAQQLFDIGYLYTMQMAEHIQVKINNIKFT